MQEYKNKLVSLWQITLVTKWEVDEGKQRLGQEEPVRKLGQYARRKVFNKKMAKGVACF